MSVSVDWAGRIDGVSLQLWARQRPTRPPVCVAAVRAGSGDGESGRVGTLCLVATLSTKRRV